MGNYKFVILLAFIFLAGQINAQTGRIKVNIEGIENTDGELQIGLYNSADSFPDFEKNFKGASITADKSGSELVFDNIPVGTYAIAIWHDENKDKELNKNMFGAPKEKYGFSNNVFGTFGPPDFEDASFLIIEGETKVLSINLK